MHAVLLERCERFRHRGIGGAHIDHAIRRAALGVAADRRRHVGFHRLPLAQQSVHAIGVVVALLAVAGVAVMA